MRGFVCSLLLLILSMKTTTTGAVTLKNRMRELIIKPNREVLNMEQEIKKIQFDRYEEVSYHDSASGIEVEDWDDIVDAIATEYDIPEIKISRLKMAKKMTERDSNNYKYKISEEKKGEFAYMQIVVGKEDGLMSYKLVGTRVDFKIKPAVQRKTKIDIFFFSIEYSTDESVPAEVENRLEDYFLYKARLSAGLHYGFREDL